MWGRCGGDIGGTCVALLARLSMPNASAYISPISPLHLPYISPGELALLYNSPRAATVLCEENGVLWALERKAFRCDAGEMQGRCRGDTGEI